MGDGLVSRIASAPARVNLLGEHVDHQGGTVMPVAVHFRTTVEYLPAEEWTIVSADHPEGGEWTRYVRGVIDLLGETAETPAPGRVEVTSTIPERRGLGSSGALEVAVAGALGEMAPLEPARLCRRAENERVGVPCGLMDQMTSACAIAGHVLVFDCGEESFFHLPLPEADLLLFDSGVERGLAETPYAERLEEARRKGTPAARHVEEERVRVLEGIELLDRGDAAGFGRLLFQSHASLRDLYRCSTPALDGLVDRLAQTPGVHGARLTGAGWGGCVVALAEPGVRPEGAVHLVSDDGLTRLA
jgi:galactokinase